MEPFFGGSHRQWAEGLRSHSRHCIDIMSLPGRHWKWRMHQSAPHFARNIQKLKKEVKYDIILCSDMVDVASLRGLLSVSSHKSWHQKIPIITYFHENQITYPWSPSDPDKNLQRDRHYGWINLMTAISTDMLVFNSKYHKSSFIDALPDFLGRFPDKVEIDIDHMHQKSVVIPLGLSLSDIISAPKPQNAKPVILWNHRWEYDKNPDLFFDTLFRLHDEDIDFNLVVLGENHNKYPGIFDRAKKILAEKILHWGYTESKDSYHRWLLFGDILPVTSNQDFFGISAIEGIAAGCFPLLPRRLAFPEHLPDDDKAFYYYDTPQELYMRLKSLIKNRPPCSIRTEVMKYDWTKVIGIYDDFFGGMYI